MIEISCYNLALFTIYLERKPQKRKIEAELRVVEDLPMMASRLLTITIIQSTAGFNTIESQKCTTRREILGNDRASLEVGC